MYTLPVVLYNNVVYGKQFQAINLKVRSEQFYTDHHAKSLQTVSVLFQCYNLDAIFRLA